MAEPTRAGIAESARPRVTRLLSVLTAALRMCWSADRRSLGASLAVQITAGLGAAAQLLLARRLLEEVVAPGDDLIARATLTAIAVVVVTTILGLFGIIQSTLSMVLAEAVALRATGRILDVAMVTEPIIWDDPAFHNRLERARGNAAARPIMAINGLLGVIGGLTGAAGVALALLAIDPLLVPLSALAVVPAWLASAVNSRSFHQFSRQLTPADRRRSYLMHVLSNRELAKELRVYGMEVELRRRHDVLHRDRLERTRALARRRRRTSALAAIGGAVATAATLGYLLWAIEAGRLDLPSAGTALFSLLFIGQRLRSLVAGAGVLYEAGLFLDEISEFEQLAHERPAMEPGEAALPLPPFDRLATRAVRFRYPGSEIDAVAGVDVEINRGEVVALVGENGSGKTTLAKMLAGIQEPTDGSILWDDTDLAHEHPARLRRSVAVVFQDYAKLQLTAADNVVLGGLEDELTRADVERAGQQAGADAVVDGLPDGWDQQLGRLFEGGVDLSGGQWQRLALARALYRDAQFVILDEPSSALDPRAEASLFERMRTLVEGRAVLFISHRFSTVRMADRIYVMESGVVAEAGTHDELMAADGLYADLYRLQAATFSN